MATSDEIDLNFVNPKPDKKFSGRLRSLELTLENKTTNVTVSFEEEYFWSGDWFEHFSRSSIKPGETSKAFVASKFLALAGVTGGLMFKIIINGIREPSYLIIGFTNPSLGCYKTYIEVSGVRLGARHGYNNAKDNTHKICECNGFKVEAVFAASNNGGGKHMKFLLSDTC